MSLALPASPLLATPAAIARAAAAALREELAAYPKPGLVSFVDCGSHPDLCAAHFLASIDALEPWFARLAEAGSHGADFAELQCLGLGAEAAMLEATGGRNTHRGAIFTLGLLAAAAGWKTRPGFSAGLGLEDVVRERWAEAIPAPAELPATSHGLAACRRHGLGGARGEAARGFPCVYRHGLPALRHALGRASSEAAHVHTFFALLAACEDTTTLHRGGPEGWDFARRAAADFLQQGGALRPGWQARARDIHRAFVARRLTAGGTADLLAATLFVYAAEGAA